jgi:hypothetical protein
LGWFKIEVARDTGFEEIQTRFADIWQVRGAPKDAAMFSETVAGRVSLYFSPGAASIAAGLLNQHGGIPSAAPSTCGLLVGHHSAVDRLVGERRHKRARDSD